MNLYKKFSLPHYDNWEYPSCYYDAIKNSTQQFKDEIYDIYFGKNFKYKYLEEEFNNKYTEVHEVRYGNVMGIEASDDQVDCLFKIQKEFGIEISLTINQLNIPIEIFYSKNDRVLGAFLEWLQQYYDRGLRSCTLANNHLMRSGILQQRFPEMKWKNTVNHQVSTAQQVLDYLSLGYNVVQLDRALNRNMDELKRIKEAVENYKNKHQGKYVRTCMLVWEGCMPSCPFKREHDDLQIYVKVKNYWDSELGKYSCQRWREGRNIVPRCGTNCYWVSGETFKGYADMVDIFKYSGRLSIVGQNPHGGKIQAQWVYQGNDGAGSFSEILENNLDPVHAWRFRTVVPPDLETDINSIKEDLKKDFWLTDKCKKLEQRLKNCRSQCYQCHLCENVFGLAEFDSLIEL